MAQKRTNSKTPKRRHVSVTLRAPEAQSVVVAGSFSDWQTDQYVLKRNEEGTWQRRLTVEPGTYEYRFIVDGQWHDDPQCAERIPNVFGTENCVLHV